MQAFLPADGHRRRRDTPHSLCRLQELGKFIARCHGVLYLRLQFLPRRLRRKLQALDTRLGTRRSCIELTDNAGKFMLHAAN